MLARLVIVSNKVAIPDKNAAQRAGGLEVAVNAAFKDRPGIWFGWSGKVTTQTKFPTQKVLHDQVTYITVDLSREDYKEYYTALPIVCCGRSCTIASTSPSSRAAI